MTPRGAQHTCYARPHASRPAAEDMGVDHGRAHIFVPQKLLDCPNILAGFQQVRRKGMPETVAARPLGDASLS